LAGCTGTAAGATAGAAGTVTLLLYAGWARAALLNATVSPNANAIRIHGSFDS
jgi:hypothetical protein